MLRFPSHGDEAPGAGFILVAVLWILGALATLAVIYSLYVRTTAAAFVDHDERLEAQALAVAGIELAAYHLTASPEARPLQGQFTFQQGTATIAAAFRAENARIDLNFAPKELLAGLFSGFGVGRDDASGYAERIISWRTPLSSGASDPEETLYRAAGKSYGPRHGPFQHVNELALVVNLPPPLIDRALPLVTVYSGKPEINVLVAPPQVLAAVPGMTPERLQLMLDLREHAPQDVVRAQLGLPGLTLEGSNVNRVGIDVRFQSGHRMYSEAVILLSDAGAEPYRVLSWRDAEPSTGERLAP